MTIEIVLDTETTGIDPRQGHRMIEIGMVELKDLIPTGRVFHTLINPEREIDPGAIRVHGITDDMVIDQPLFSDLMVEILAFIGTNKVVAHNAAFDRGFINHEIKRLGGICPPDDQWIDSLEIARLKFPGIPNSLDALCRRFDISLDGRDKHGALIDAKLLAQVYLELNGGIERSLGLETEATIRQASDQVILHGQRPSPLPSRLLPDTIEIHKAFIKKTWGDKTLWKL